MKKIIFITLITSALIHLSKIVFIFSQYIAKKIIWVHFHKSPGDMLRRNLNT